MLMQNLFLKKLWLRTSLCCRTFSLYQLQDGSIDGTEFYEPLSGKVMLCR